MKTITDRQPGAGEIVMICAHSAVKSATLHGAHLIKIPGGPRVFSNLDDRFFSEWLYLCDDCHECSPTWTTGFSRNGYISATIAMRKPAPVSAKLRA